MTVRKKEGKLGLKGPQFYMIFKINRRRGGRRRRIKRGKRLKA